MNQTNLLIITLLLTAIGTIGTLIYEALRLHYERKKLKFLMGEERSDVSKLCMAETTDDRIGKILRKLKDDPVYFSKLLLKFKPFWYQQSLMRSMAKRIAACWGRQTGKTWCIAAKTIHFAYTNPDSTILIISRGLRQSMLMFQVIANFIMDSPILRRSLVRYTRTIIKLKNGAQIVALPCSQNGANLRGYTADVVIMDEAAFMPEPVIAGVVFPMLATTEMSRGTGIAIMISTPWGQNHIFYRCFTNPEWFVMRVMSEQCPLITQKFLKEQRELVGELRYETEYEAKFREDATALFPQDLIRGIIETDWYDSRVRETNNKPSQPELITDDELMALGGKFTGRHCMGIDIGKRRDYSEVSIFRKSKRVVAKELWREVGAELKEIETETIKPAWILVYQKRFDLGTKLTAVANHCLWLTQKFNVVKAAIDKTQIGEMVFEVIQADFPLLEGVYLSLQAKQSVMQSFHLMVEQRRVGVPFGDDYKDIITQMAEQQYGYSQGQPRADTDLSEQGVMRYWHPDGRKDDKLWSMALAIYSITSQSARHSVGAI